MKKIILLVAIAFFFGAYFYFDLGQWLTLEQLKAQQSQLEAYRSDNPILVAGIYVVAYIIMAALSLPGAAIMTLTGGAVFGVVWGTLLANLSATIGATLAFIIARYFLADWVQKKFGDRVEPINRGVKKDGAFYLFTLRLVPAVPFFVINIVMALTPLRVWTFFWVSVIGMIAGAAVYANAGTQLAKIETLSGIMSPSLILSFVLLGVFPLIARKTLEFVNAKKTSTPAETEGSS